MKLLLFLFICLSFSKANEWKLRDISLTTENDADFRTDRDYTYGSEIGALFEMQSDRYLSLSIAHQMYTPNDFDKEDVDLNKERPYAGYMYLGGGYHEVKKNRLDSLNIQIGFVGPSVKMDDVQKIIHDIIGSPEPKGWEDQIGDELILQINYERRWFDKVEHFFGDSANIVYYAGGNLGNLSIKAVGGAFYRIGWSVENDFAPRRIDYRGYSNIPLKLDKKKQKQSFWFSLWAEGSIVARDIFLDGNTFKESVSIDKEIFVAKGGFGMSYRYKRFQVDYLRTYSTKEFKLQNYYHSYGTLHFSYNF